MFIFLTKKQYIFIVKNLGHSGKYKEKIHLQSNCKITVNIFMHFLSGFFLFIFHTAEVNTHII